MVRCVIGIGGCGTMIPPARCSGVVMAAMAANLGILGVAVEAEPGGATLYRCPENRPSRSADVGT
jgi:hypothetical protein